MSQMIDEMFDEDEDMDDKKVPLPNVSSEVLRKVIEFGKHYQEEQMTPIQTPLKSSNIDDLVQKWYAEFVDLPQKQLFELVAAANYLNIKPLLDLTVLAVSILIKVRRRCTSEMIDHPRVRSASNEFSLFCIVG